jgi:lysophospholipase L1-like esterase
LHKYIYTGPQLQAAVKFLRKHAGRVSPVTLDIGINDLLPNFESAKCTIDARWERNLATLDNNLKDVILPQLSLALTVNGQVSGDLLLLNYYDPYQDSCPNTLQAIQTLNRHLAADASGYALSVDVFSSLRGPLSGKAALPIASICKYTWMCSTFKDVHPNKAGYSAMVSAIEHTVNY